ncbi:MAG TPA: METTL5 family protein [Thermoplasmata archaeon]|nr:METTL5 family protein [Thermoplasmata archaeon]
MERALQSLERIPRPAAASEQYTTPAPIAAEVLYLAHGHGDLAGRSVVDLGCGNGILAIGAKLLGAARVLGVDSDPTAIGVARRNGRRVKADVEWVLADVRAVHDVFDTVVMNPPFGAQSRHADRPFLDTALAVGSVVYTFMNGTAEAFVRRRVETSGGRITERLEYAFPIPHLFPFHREAARKLAVVLYRVEVAKG